MLVALISIACSHLAFRSALPCNLGTSGDRRVRISVLEPHDEVTMASGRALDSCLFFVSHCEVRYGLMEHPVCNPADGGCLEEAV